MTSISLAEGSNETALSVTVNGTGGAGYMQLANQSSNPSTPASSLRIFSDNSGRFSWKRTDGWVRTLDSTSLTADRVWTLPDVNDTILTVTSTATLQNKTILGGANSNDITANALKNATGVVSVSAATAPSTGQVLKATGTTTATWQAESTSGVSYALIASDFNTTNTTYTNATTTSTWGQIYFPGSTTVTLSAVYFIGHMSGSGGFKARLYDATNNLVICETTGITASTDTIFTNTTLSNIPTSQALLQVQIAKTSGSGTAYLTGLALKYS